MYRPDSWIHLYICIKILVRVPNRHVLRETQNLEFGRLFNIFLLCEVTRDMQEDALFIVLNPLFFSSLILDSHYCPPAIGFDNFLRAGAYRLS